MRKKIAILGSTGSIGNSLLKIIKKDKKNFQIKLLSANKNYSQLLKQAKLDNVKTFELLDTLKGLEEVQLSRVVTEVLNFQRHKGSTLGFKVDTNIEYFEKRNIVV